MREITGQKRISLSGHSFEIRGENADLKYKVDVGRLVGYGASCLVYEVVVDDLYPPKKNMIMKEFYPNFKEDVLGIRDNENPINIHFKSDSDQGILDIVGNRKKFIEAYDKHIRIMEIDPVLDDKIVRPYKLEKSKDYLFALYETDSAQSVDKYYNLDLGRIIDILMQSADILSLLHQKDIIYMDLKPANILYDYKRNKVKLFDFDAAVFLDEIDDINEFFMPDQRAFIPPELRYISNIEKRKDIFISEEIDLYMLGVTFFFLLMDRYPEELENENMEYLDRNIREVLLRQNNRLFLNNQTIENIVDLLKESLSIHRYLTVDEFKERLTEIQAGLDRSNNQKIANILSAAYIIENKPLYNFINQDENGDYVDIAIVGNLKRGMDFFNLLFAAVDLIDIEIRFTIYNANPRGSLKYMTDVMPLLKETTKLSVEGKNIDDYINPIITDEPYAKIDFSKKIQDINDHYIIILHEDGKNYYDLAQGLFDKFKDIKENRVIFNFTRYIKDLEEIEGKYVGLYNIDLASAESFRSKQYSQNILEEAYEIHKFYTRAYGGERVDDSKVWENFIKNDLYSLKSSIRTALSMKYRIYMSGSYLADDIARDFYDKIVKVGRSKDELTFRDIFADREHHSWNKFMITLGYRRPNLEEFKEYAYVGTNNHIDRVRKLHPLIANTDIKKYKSGQDDEFALVCRRINRFLQKKTKDMDFRVLDRIANTLNTTSWFANANLQEILPLWEELYNITKRIIYKEAFAETTLNVITDIIDQRLSVDFLGKDDLLADYKLIKQDIRLLLRNEDEESFRASDYMIIDAKPQIKSAGVKTIFAPFVEDEDYLWANIIATIKFVPQNLILVTDDKDRVREKFEKIKSFMKDKRLQKSLNVDLITYDEMKLYSKERAIVDLSQNSHVDARRPEFKDLPYVEYMGSNNWAGDFKAKDYYLSKRTLTIEEAFFLNNAKYYNAASENNLAKLSNYYEKLFKAYLSYSSYEWSEFINLFRNSIDSYILNLDYKKCEDSRMLEVGDYLFRRGDSLKYTKLTSFLNDLKREGILIDYKFPVNPGKLKLHSINDYLSVDLGDFISKAIKKDFQIFDYRKLFFPLLDEKTEKNIYTYAMTNNVNFSYKAKHDDAQTLALALNKFMVNIDKDVDNDKDIRMFNHINGKEYVKADGNVLEFNYELGDIAFREFFEKGIALQTYTYFELIRKSRVFDDIKIDVRLKWKAYDDLDPISEGVENHLDIVCTKEFSTFIIACLQDELKRKDIYELTNNAKHFGIDTKAILINSYSEGINSSVRKIADSSGIYLIDRKMLEDDKLVYYLENIARAKTDWKNLEIGE